jgi:hypothetical protein
VLAHVYDDLVSGVQELSSLQRKLVKRADPFSNPAASVLASIRRGVWQIRAGDELKLGVEVAFKSEIDIALLETLVEPLSISTFSFDIARQVSPSP